MPFSQGLAAVQRTKDGKFGYIDRTGRIRVETKYDQVYAFSEGLAAVENNSRDASGSEQIVRGYIDRTGTVKFQVIEPLTTINKLRGYIGPSGGFKIQPWFTSAGAFHEGFAKVGHETIWP